MNYSALDLSYSVSELNLKNAYEVSMAYMLNKFGITLAHWKASRQRGNPQQLQKRKGYEISKS